MSSKAPVVLAIALALAGCHRQPAATTVDPELTRFIPSDILGLAHANVIQIRQSAVWQKLIEPNLARRIPPDGFDPSRDLRELLIASDGKNAVLIARGDFARVSLPSAPSGSYQGYQIYEGGGQAFTRIDSHTALGGTPAAVRGAIDQYKTGGSSVQALLERARQIAGSHPVWAVGNGWMKAFLQVLPASGNLANLKPLLRPVRETTLFADLDSGAHVTATGTCDTEQSAAQLAGTATALIAIARAGRSAAHPEVPRLLEALRIEAQQNVVRAEATLPAELLEQLLRQTE